MVELRGVFVLEIYRKIADTQCIVKLNSLLPFWRVLRFTSCKLVQQHSRLLRLLQYSFLDEYISCQLLWTIIKHPYVWTIRRLIAKIWSQLIDKNLHMQGLIIQFFIHLLVPLSLCMLSLRYLLETHQLLLLLLVVVLEDSYLFLHLLLREHVVLETALQNLGGLTSFS